jgi:hypothetical protein
MNDANDASLLNALEEAGNVAIWHGFYQPRGEPRKPLVAIYRTDDEGSLLPDEDGESELSRGETLREAIENL